jgi:hypothetical protein
MQNCRFEDNFTDFGLFGKVNTPIYKCDPPATNAVWGMGAMGGPSAVMSGMAPIEANVGVPAWGGGGNILGAPPSFGAFGAFGQGMAAPAFSGAGSFSGGVVSGLGSVATTTNAPKWETCNSDEVDTGLTCEKPSICSTEEDKNQPIRGPFGEILGYMWQTTCTKPSVRAKKQY